MVRLVHDSGRALARMRRRTDSQQLSSHRGLERECSGFIVGRPGGRLRTPFTLSHGHVESANLLFEGERKIGLVRGLAFGINSECYRGRLSCVGKLVRACPF